MATGELKSTNARSPRFSTSKALGFRGGATGPGGNLQEPTLGQVQGTQRSPEAASGEAPISQFDAGSFRAAQAPSATGSIGQTVVGAGAGEVAKEGGRRILSAAKDYLGGSALGRGLTAGASGGATAAASGAARGFGGSFSNELPSVGRGFAGGSSFGDGLQIRGTEAANFGGNFAGGAADAAGLIDTGADFSLFGETAGDAAGGIPYLGAGLRAASGDYGGALGSAAGYAVGGPVGGFIGGAVGNALGCFITEAVMSTEGKGDSAEELEVLRQFRDEVLMQTPEGQKLIAEYEQIAPVVVEAVMQREDSLQIFQAIDAKFIQPAVMAVKAQDFNQALQVYAQMINYVAQFASEGMEADGGDPGAAGAIDQFGAHAAIVGNDPMASGMATGDMGMMDPNPNAYDGGPQGGGGQPAIMEQFASKPRY